MSIALEAKVTELHARIESLLLAVAALEKKMATLQTELKVSHGPKK